MKKSASNSLKGFSTNSMHVEGVADQHHAHNLPIYATSTYFFEEAEDGKKLFSGQKTGYSYNRFGNPNTHNIECIIAQLEGLNAGPNGTNLPLKAILHASGMAAINTALLSLLKQGDTILTHYSLYGGTSVLMDNLLPNLGIQTVVNSFEDMNAVEEQIKKDKSIKVIYIETPANPTLHCVDIEAVCQLAKKYNLKTICDNTFNTAFIQQPFQWGIDFVVHSTTKFLNGHGTSIGGILIGKDIELMTQKVKKTFNVTGGCASPFDAYLLANGVKTLELRMMRHCDNARRLAEFLKQHPKVDHVAYLGFHDNPYHAIASKQMRYFGSILNVELKGNYNTCMTFMNALELATIAVSLGTCDTLVCHTYSTTHLAVPDDKKHLYGIKENQLRINVGIENIEDIIYDFDHALQSI